MKNNEMVVSTFKEIKIGSRHIGIFHATTGNWVRAELKEKHSDHFLMLSHGLRNFPQSHMYLCQLAFSFIRRFSFITEIIQDNGQLQLKIPKFFLPIHKADGPEDASSKRENYRVSPNEENIPVSFYPKAANKPSKILQGHLSDISTGGIGISVDDVTLQTIGNNNRFIIEFDSNSGLKDDKGKPLIKSIIELDSRLCNARPLRNQRVNLGFSFFIDNNPIMSSGNITHKISNYVASRQRQMIQKRINVRDH